MVKYEPKTYVITAAQGIQNPYSAKMYGRDETKGSPNIPLIKNIENYVEFNKGELQICGIAGSYVNEIDLHEFFHTRDDVYIHIKAKQRNEQHRKTEQVQRDFWEEQKAEVEAQGKTFRRPYPMYYFWETIPNVDYKITGKRLNTNVRIVGKQGASQNQNPLSGKKRLTKKYGGNSIILPATKQRLETVASGQAGEYPKLMLTSGSCTFSSYNSSIDRGEDAEEMHQYGFVTVNVLNDKIFLPRIVNAQKNGTFIDLGIKYIPGKEPKKAKTTAMVIGDSHVSEINPKVETVNREMIQLLKPKHIHYNDVFNARSINLHELDDDIEESNKFVQGISSLEEELVLTGKYIKENALIAKEFLGEVVINYSNHDDMLYRYLSGNKFKHDKENRIIAYKILSLGIDRYNTFEKAIKYLINDLPDNVTFLKPGQDRIYWGIQCAAHGHLGKNGTRGTLKSLMEGYLKVMMGHTHTLGVDEDGYNVGTSSKIPLKYQLGQPSTSMAGNGAIYDGGLAQIIPIIKSQWAPKNVIEFLMRNKI
ncbi:MAG: hypothetical protein QT05_C0013G0015 [archaeon GW2011_AR13]|nr:MAG: hypothetical protein QT05_C0013G0015 [archaeon GW2011_AR13]HIG94986.1 hypothetical protein [Nanoarchaeota archaeon]HIH62902.1 hypothetical protein [Nanoarchaeota archaeon]HIJ10319.1 hypothetical protein [Nanoarchaeota archaeon]